MPKSDLDNVHVVVWSWRARHDGAGGLSSVAGQTPACEELLGTFCPQWRFTFEEGRYGLRTLLTIM